MNIDGLEPHPLAACRPEMQPMEYEALKRDIAERNLCQPILTFEGKILDGRHRVKVARELDLTLEDDKVTVFTGSDTEAIALVLDNNSKWFHLSNGQKAITATRLHSAGAIAENPLTQLKLAERFSISERQIRNAAEIESANPSLADLVANREATIGLSLVLLAGPKSRLQAYLEGDRVQRKAIAKEARRNKPPAVQPFSVTQDLLQAIERLANCENVKKAVDALDDDSRRVVLGKSRVFWTWATTLQNMGRASGRDGAAQAEAFG